MKKIVTLLIAFALLVGTFSGLCLTTNAENAQKVENTGISPNLLEMYGLNPSFNDGLKPWDFNAANSEQCDEDSADDDGYCAKLTKRTATYVVPSLTRVIDIFNDQGDGVYYYSFYVKCVKKGATCKIGPRVQLSWGGAHSQESVDAGIVKSSFLYGQEYGAKLDSFEVNGTEWTKVEMRFNVKLNNDNKALTNAMIYANQAIADFANNKVDLLFDNYSLVKETGTWIEVTPEPKITIPAQTRVNEVNRSEKTAVGVVNYFMWQETIEEWWKHDNNYLKGLDENSGQEARCLSPDKYHYRLPFWTEMKTDITAEDTKLIKGDVTSIPEFPEYTEEIWRQEMEYAIDAGIDYMAYLWTNKGRKQNGAYMHHINTKGMDGRLKMCAIMSNESQDLNAMANAAVEDYWFTVDGMPVVYIYGGEKAATEDLIIAIRKKIALAQYVKYGEVGKPAYVVSMGIDSYQTAVGISARGLDATSWYGIGSSPAATAEQNKYWNSHKEEIYRTVTYKALVDKNLEIMTKVAKVAEKEYMSVIPLATLGFNTNPRIDNPVTWVSGETYGTKIPYDGYTTEDPTPEEVTESILDTLNFNKENAKYFRANSIIIYAWNEFDEGGWFCPTVEVDEQGNVLKNADGTNKINREYLDAVKKGIQLYREHEAEAAIYDVDGNKIKDIDMTISAETSKPTQKPSATATADASQDDQNQENNGWVLWAIIGGAVVVVAAAAVVVVVILKKKKAATQTEE